MMLHRHFEEKQNGTLDETRSKMTTSAETAMPEHQEPIEQVSEKPKRGRPRKPAE